jgi:hypothetical protein
VHQHQLTLEEARRMTASDVKRQGCYESSLVDIPRGHSLSDHHHST